MPRSSGRSRAGRRSSIRLTARRWSPTSPTRCSVAASRSTGSTGSSARDTGEERWVHGRGTLELDAVRATAADARHDRRHHRAAAARRRRSSRPSSATRRSSRARAEAILIAEVATQRFRWVNPAACALLGYTRDELLELTVHDIHPADGPAERSSSSSGRSRTGASPWRRSIPCRAQGRHGPAGRHQGRRRPSWTGWPATSASSPTSPSSAGSRPRIASSPRPSTRRARRS